MNKALFFIYDGFAEFEINLLSFFLKSKNYEIETFTIDSEKKIVTGESGFLFQPHKLISEIDHVDSYELFAIPGGPIFDLMTNEALLNLVRAFHEKDKWIAAICAGTGLAAKAGILENVPFSTSLSPAENDVQHIHNWIFKQKDDVTVHGNIITSTASAYVEFASEVIKQLNLYEPGEENETLAYFKNFNRGDFN
ncbi:DJ-1/PfpI family protein [Virgibacillus oceani]|uniref:Thiazole biosynthesis protein ThiJ n=1 Tax=Virgibacillus oceani TaxID=1479511 RepID=A0A917HN49_9BACI|nr:DJ-1/PfpI family protein [Virgibacillus oceani]GGG83710.1 thiazole biosynthesis protein ThiJ [Virgibacillus oceani]